VSATFFARASDDVQVLRNDVGRRSIKKLPKMEKMPFSEDLSPGS
jgi:hypothetical protein